MTIQAMTTSDAPRAPRLNPKKLLLSKWTAVQPQDKEKHYIVTELVQAESPLATAQLPRSVSAPNQPRPIVDIVIQAVYSGRCITLPWRELTDTSRWRQGWR